MSARERREVAFLAMCFRNPAEGRSYLDRTTPEHFSTPMAARAFEWLVANLDDPMAKLDREDRELYAFVTDIVMRSENEPASRQSIELNFLELERGVVDREIASLRANGGEGLVALQRKRAELNERIARASGF